MFLQDNIVNVVLTSSCLQFGKIYEVRMMMDFNGNNRGYAFVTFSTKQEAKTAMKQLNNYEIRSGSARFLIPQTIHS